MFVQKLAAAGNLGSCLPRDGKLRRGQRFPPFLRRFVNLALPNFACALAASVKLHDFYRRVLRLPALPLAAGSNWLRDPVPRTHPQSPAPQRRKSVRDESDHSSKKLQRRPAFGPYFPLIAGAGKSGGRFGSPRAPRTSSSSNSSDGATTEVGRPFCAEPNAPSAVPANPATCVCM